MKPIHTEDDYRVALAEVEALWDSPDRSEDADRLEVLALLVEDYERKHYAVDPPDPVDFLLHVMESRGLSRKDMEPHIGSRGRVAEILNRVRPLTLDMIRRLSKGLGIPAEILVRDYELRKAA